MKDDHHYNFLVCLLVEQKCVCRHPPSRVSNEWRSLLLGFLLPSFFILNWNEWYCFVFFLLFFELFPICASCGFCKSTLASSAFLIWCVQALLPPRHAWLYTMFKRILFTLPQSLMYIEDRKKSTLYPTNWRTGTPRAFPSSLPAYAEKWQIPHFHPSVRTSRPPHWKEKKKKEIKIRSLFMLLSSTWIRSHRVLVINYFPLPKSSPWFSSFGDSWSFETETKLEATKFLQNLATKIFWIV